MSPKQMNTKHLLMYLLLAVGGSWLPLATPALAAPPPSCTSTQVSENFTGYSTNCTWYYFGGACLTAGNIPSTGTSSPGFLPQCLNDPYYGAQVQVGGNSGNLNTTPDVPYPTPTEPIAGGALRFTNDANAQSGAIVSNFAFALAANGLQVTFTTETYEGDSGGGNHDGADGMSFFLVDDSYVESANPVTGASYGANNGGPYGVTLGDWGGSLGYTCSNTNNSAGQGYAGMIGGYIGLGIDEYGNFLNGDGLNAAGAITYSGDNTSSGYGYVPNRIGLRGAGATAWAYLNQSPATAAYYPSTLSNQQKVVAVHQACQTGYVWDYSAVDPAAPPTATWSNGVYNPYSANPQPVIPLTNYAAIPNAFKILPQNIANEAARYRGYATPATTGPNYGIPITYNLSISTQGLLSLSYSFAGGNFQPIITGQSILNNGALPSMVRFGFGGSTGGSRNIHEIMCFQASPQNSSASSAGLNQKQTAKVQTGTQVYFAFYNANNWTGSLTSQYLDSANGTSLQIDPLVNWDGSCVLTGVPATQTCATTGVAGYTAPEDPDAGRVILTYNPATGTGIPFTWSAAGATPLSAGEQANLNDYDPEPNSNPAWPFAPNLRLEYLRGQRADEQNAFGVDPSATPQVATTPPAPAPPATGFRARTSVLGDIIDSSPTWVGSPNASFPTTWTDYLYPATVMPENTGQPYTTFQSTYASRINVVYAGANDGFLHGFRTGFFDANGLLDGTTPTSPYGATDNDGAEVLAFMPAYVLNQINSGNSFQSATGTYIANPSSDYSSPLYAHKFSVDGTPGDGDLFYNGQWHSWLVGGLGSGGSALYALDVTNPGIGTPGSTTTPAATAGTSFMEANAANLVIGEWSSSLTYTTTGTGPYTTQVSGSTATFSCANVPGCGASLGRNNGTPQIRRFHNTPANSGGATSWGAVFGNGVGSFNGDAGIFVMLAGPSGGSPTFYYLSTGYGSRMGTPDGIQEVAPADLDGDHIIDYVYAGDILGNVWRFDLTSQNPNNWTVTQVGGTPTPVYSSPNGSPITTRVMVAAVASTPMPRILIEFGTGQQQQFTNSSPAKYASTQQYLIGVWDWNMGPWNAISNVQYDALTATTTPVAPTSGGVPAPINGTAQLEQQSITGSYDQTGVSSAASTSTTAAAYFRTVSSNCIGWADYNSGCGSSNQYGWYLPLGTGYANPSDPAYLTSTTSTGTALVDEQVIFNPSLQGGAFIVNTTIPPTTSINSCSSTSAGGWSMAINPATGGALPQSYYAINGQFTNINGQIVSGAALNGTGSSSTVQWTPPGGALQNYLVTQTINGKGTIVQVNPPGGSLGNRLTWIERR
jgi:type IV pilus assembly protein PilY1